MTDYEILPCDHGRMVLPVSYTRRRGMRLRFDLSECGLAAMAGECEWTRSLFSGSRRILLMRGR